MFKNILHQYRYVEDIISCDIETEKACFKWGDLASVRILSFVGHMRENISSKPDVLTLGNCLVLYLPIGYICILGRRYPDSGFNGQHYPIQLTRLILRCGCSDFSC